MTIEIGVEWIRLVLILFYTAGLVISVALAQVSTEDPDGLLIVLLPIVVGLTFGSMLILINL